jgi:hypothetical protein
MTIVSSAPFTNLGMTLQSADVDGDGTKDLLVGNPYAKAPLIESGELLVFLSSTTRSNGQIVDADSSDWSLKGPDYFDWFSAHVVVGNIDQKRVMIIGSPLYNNGSTALGKIYCYDVTNFTSKDSTPLWTIEGIDLQGKFGFSFDLGEPVTGKVLLAVGIPNKLIPAVHIWEDDKSQAGAVVLISVSNLSGDYTLNQLSKYVEIQSNEVSLMNEFSLKFPGICTTGMGCEVYSQQRWNVRSDCHRTMERYECIFE